MSRRTATRPEIRVGGFWLSSIVPQGWGELKHSTRLNGGWQVSWTIPNTRTWRHPALVYGARVELCLGPLVIISGTLQEPNWDDGEFVAFGASREAETAISLDGSGNSSTAPNTILDAGISRGVLSWTRVDNFGTTPMGDANAGLVTIRSVLDAWAQKNDSRWVVNEQRQAVISPVNEADPKWFIVPGSGVLGSASDRVDRVFVRFINSATGRRETASYPATTPAGGVEKPVDLIANRGAMTASAAQGEAQSIWNEQQGRPGFANGWTLVNGQVTTKGGGTADLALIKAGDTVAALGLPDSRGIAHNTLVVIGETEYDWEDDELQVNPVGLAPRDTQGVLESVGNLALDAMATASSGTSSRPVGEITMFHGVKSAIPAGWLPLDGSSFSGAAYPELQAALGGSTTLPDWTDRLPIGAGIKSPGSTGGSATKTITAANLPAEAVIRGGTTYYFNQGTSTPDRAQNGGGQALDVMPPWIATWFIIRAAR